MRIRNKESRLCESTKLTHNKGHLETSFRDLCCAIRVPGCINRAPY
uniref:Uncharacterized protein n=1 Tax=Anguilla anguilla TaxID=7936 RepID=A0A0E9PRC5_ANGAN